MNDATRKLLENLQGLADPRGFSFREDGDSIQAKAPYPLPNGVDLNLLMFCADDRSLICVSAPQMPYCDFHQADDLRALLNLQERFRLLRCHQGRTSAHLGLRLEFFLPECTLPTSGSSAYGTILDLSACILGPALAFVRGRLTTGSWDDAVIRQEPQELKALKLEIQQMEQTIGEKRRRADGLRNSVIPESRTLPFYL